MKLIVANSRGSDAYKDIARVSEAYRRDERGDVIPGGRICRVFVGGRDMVLSIRGQHEHSNAISLDEKTRHRLAVSIDEEGNFCFQPVGLLGQFAWAWNATDPAYRSSSIMR